MAFFDYIFMIGYLVVVIFVGTLCTRKQKDTESYLLGGSNIPWWAVAISYMMALVSTLSLVATPGEAYNYGVRMYLRELIGIIPALIFFHLFMRFYFATKTFTPFEYLEKRFDKRIRGIISIIYFFTRISYLSIVLFSCSMIFKGAANISPWIIIVIVGGISTFYCTLGGMRAVVWTNVLQFIVLIGGLTAVTIACVSNVEGGARGCITYAFENGRGFNASSLESDFFSFDPHVRVTVWLLLFGAITGYMFYNCADQIAIQQLLSTSSYKKARSSYLTSIIVFVPMGLLLWFIGLAVFSYFGQNPLEGGNPPGDTALFKFISLKMPTPLPGLMVSAMLAAVISTVSAGITSFATIATKDFYLTFFKPSASEQQELKFSRFMTLFIGLLATALGLLIIVTSSRLRETVLEASAVWIAISAVVAPAFFVGMLNKRCNANHILTAIILGWTATGIMVAWYIIGRVKGNPISFMYIQVPGTIIMMAYGFIAPLLFGKKVPEEKLKNLTYMTFDKRILE